MALQINQYAVEELGPIDPNTWFDIDAVDAPFESRKLKFSVLQSELLGGLTATNGLTKGSSTNVKLGGSILENTLVTAEDTLFSLEFKGGTTGALNAVNSIRLDDDLLTLGQNRTTDVNEFMNMNFDINGGLSGIFYSTATASGSMELSTSGLRLRASNPVTPLVEAVFTLNAGNAVLDGRLHYRDGTEGNIGDVLVSTDAQGQVQWAAAPAGPNLYNTDGTLTGNRVVTQGANTLTIEGNSKIFKGIDDLATTNLSLQNSSGSEKVKIQSDGDIFTAINQVTTIGKLTNTLGVHEIYGNNNTALNDVGITQAIISNEAAAANVGGGLSLGGKYNGANFTSFGFIQGVKEAAGAGFEGNLVFNTLAGSGANTSEGMRIFSDGNVSIGGATNNGALHIGGVTNIDGNTTINGATTLNTTTPSVDGQVWTATGVAGEGHWENTGGAFDLSSTLSVGNTSGANNIQMDKVGTAASTATQTSSQAISLQTSLWDGATDVSRLWAAVAKPSLSVNELDFFTLQSAGVDKFTFSSDGRMGVNVAIPTASIDVLGTGTGTGKLLSLKNSASAEKYKLQDNGSSFSAANSITTIGSFSNKYSVGLGGTDIHETYGSNNTLFTNVGMTHAYFSDDAAAINVGAGIALGGKHSGSALSAFGFLQGVKEDATTNNKGNLVFRTITGAGAATAEGIRILSDGSVTMVNLPTSNPGGTGRLWSNAGVINIT